MGKQAYSGKLPFHDISIGAGVVLAVVAGRRPLRPCVQKGDANDMAQELWDLVQRCLQGRPCKRPTASDVADALRIQDMADLNTAVDNGSEVDPVSPSSTLVSDDEIRDTWSRNCDRNEDDDEILSAFNRLSLSHSSTSQASEHMQPPDVPQVMPFSRSSSWTERYVRKEFKM